MPEGQLPRNSPQVSSVPHTLLGSLLKKAPQTPRKLSNMFSGFCADQVWAWGDEHHRPYLRISWQLAIASDRALHMK